MVSADDAFTGQIIPVQTDCIDIVKVKLASFMASRNEGYSSRAFFEQFIVAVEIS